MNLYVLLLRLVHVAAGVAWVGGAAALFLFLQPAAQALAGDGQKFMGFLMTRKRFGNYLGATAGLTILAGFLLYLRDTEGFTNQWAASAPGIGFGIGSLAGIAAFLLGMLVTSRRQERMVRLAQQAIPVTGQPPSPETQAEMARLGREMNRLMVVNFTLLSIALVLMAVSRYLVF